MKKSSLRKEMKERFKALDIKDYERMSIALSENLQKFLVNVSLNGSAMKLGVFAPLPDEPDWRKVFDDSSCKTLYPTNSAKGMLFVECLYEELVESQVFGVSVMTPPEREPSQPELLLIPGLAFTERGERLGRGKGFYDRYLERFNGLKIGICFEMQLVEDLPTEDHDQLIEYIVTEKRVIDSRR